MEMAPVKRQLSMAASVLGIAASLVILTPGAAQARPTDCSSGRIHSSPEGGWAQCTQGSGHFRARIYCTSDPQNGWGIYRHGSWKLASRTAISNAYCTSSYPYLVSAGYETANW